MGTSDTTSRPVEEGALLWEPPDDVVSAANITAYMRWLRETRRLSFESYQELWRWSVTDLDAFWGSIWDFFEVIGHSPHTAVLADDAMPGARWFPGARLNYAEHALRRRGDRVAVISKSELRPTAHLTYADLYRQVARFAEGLRRHGVRRGDRVAAYMPNIPETLVAFLATASIGAVWSACSPEFGSRSVVERFQQIEPAVLIAVDGYRYGGRDFDRIDVVASIQRRLPSLKVTVLAPYFHQEARTSLLSNAVPWAEMSGPGGEIEFEPVPFDHPLWVLYSSGTTGLPKPIVQGHGGILLEHLKYLSLHADLKPEDRFFWFTTTGWMMWNLLIGGLLLGTTVVLFDGDPGYPDMNTLWRLAEETGVTYFGASAPYIQACIKAGVRPGEELDLSRVRGVGSTGAPLSPEAFRWVYDRVKADVHLGSMSGGTDLCTAFVGTCPLLPVYAGEIQCQCLGASVEAYGPEGQPLTGEVGELVITKPLPSMPLRLWNDPGGRRYRESYFETYPGVWRHGDWIKVTGRGSCAIYGRSDSTLNRGGVRMGTSDFYRVVDDMEEVLDSLVIDTGHAGRDGRLILFLVLRDGGALDDDLRGRIAGRLRRDISPRHVPNEMYAVPEVPKTLNGKKMEVPIKRILSGEPVDTAVSRDAMANPESLRPFLELAGGL